MPRIIPSIRAWSISSRRRGSRGTRDPDRASSLKAARASFTYSGAGICPRQPRGLPHGVERNSMSFNTFGPLFRVTPFGESHGPAIGCVVDGCPPGIALTEADIQPYLDRRRPGQSRYTTQRQEPDAVRILSGVFI